MNVALQLGSLASLSGFPRSVLFPNLSTFKPSNLPTVLQPSFCTIFMHSKPFRINSCKSVSKQTTSTPFRINTYEKTRGWGRGAIACVPTIPILESSAHHSSPATHHSPLHSSSFLSDPCALFCTRQKLNSFIFKLLRTLCPKTPGVGVPSQPQSGSELEPRRFFLAKDHSRCACQIAGGLLFGVV